MKLKAVQLTVLGALALMLATPMTAQIQSADGRMQAPPLNQAGTAPAAPPEGLHGQHFSPLDGVNIHNVSGLVPAWAFSLGGGSPRPLESQPVVMDGVMYVASSASGLQAIDARTGKRIRQDERLRQYEAQGLLPCCEGRGAWQTQALIPFDMIKDGQFVKAAASMDRHGALHVLDQISGAPLSPDLHESQDGAARRILPMAFSRRTGLFYVSTSTADAAQGTLKALDPATGGLVWEYPFKTPPHGGVLATAGGLVFTGTPEGALVAFDDTSGKILWRFNIGAGIIGSPISWALDGAQMISVVSGGVVSDGEGMARTTAGIHAGGMVWTFNLPKKLAAP